ncbi:hypothetical protein SAMN05660690_2561 [Geodermatophilus telluris]|uniref:Uncharacterized protein n=1 Tax=Geodermatophilus telluris TaxID=1190417 RepID=A0A1G6PG46_9ACTN|nr:hypothetical protein [Geodermatophilus telluris]SDC78998.1 hypothetical protein SAMN05660690_2561 [Geodermatophilus telluris]
MTAVVLLAMVAALLLLAFGLQRSRAGAGRRPAVPGRRSSRAHDVGHLVSGTYVAGTADSGGWGGGGFDGGGGGGCDGGGGGC